jgi:hypothetical protein
MFPVIMPVAVPQVPVQRLERLENDLGLCQSLLWHLADRLAAPCGTLSSDHTLHSALTQAAEAAGDVVASVDAHLRAGQSELAVRRLREETHAGWEDLYDVTAWWRTWSPERKLNWVRFARLRRLLGPAGPAAPPSH